MENRSICLSFFFLFLFINGSHSSSFNYADALEKALMYFEGQRSGKLPKNQRVLWRADSALSDWSGTGVNLVGGYYDAGDNVKFGFPMAFTVTLLSWGAIEFREQFIAKGQWENVKEAIRWGTDYFIKAHPQKDVLYVQVGDGNSDHYCWQRPEDMTTPRTAYRIDATNPGSDVAGETAAALAAASIVFADSDPIYASNLLNHAEQLFKFAINYPGLYDKSINIDQNYYASHDYQDELMWAAAWLHRACSSNNIPNQSYLDFLRRQSLDAIKSRMTFFWHDKSIGASTLVAKLVLEGKVENGGIWAVYKDSLDQFVCSCLQESYENISKTSGGLLWWHGWAPLQYVGSSMLIASVYSEYLIQAKSSLNCSRKILSPKDMKSFAQLQVDYVLGDNPMRMSYMVGYGDSYPLHIHHRGSSIVSVKKDGHPIECREGYAKWFSNIKSNPNALVGAIVGGPDMNDRYADLRKNYQQSEPTTYINAAFVGVIANCG